MRLSSPVPSSLLDFGVAQVTEKMSSSHGNVKQSPDLLLQRYYDALETRIGYRLFLGNTTHFGYYAHDTYWPFPITASLRRMEDHLFHLLGVPSGSKVLDAGCGMGQVAIYMARKGLLVDGIEVVSYRVDKAKKYVQAAGLQNRITIQLMDYHNLAGMANSSYDGVLTVETLVHANNPEQVLAEFFRVLKPGGSLALQEYDHPDWTKHASPFEQKTIRNIVKYSSMASFEIFETGVLERMLEDAGFVDVKAHDLSLNILPLLRLFWLVAYIPFWIITWLGLQAHFVNASAGVAGYRGYGRLWRYVAISARKPEKL